MKKGLKFIFLHILFPLTLALSITAGASYILLQDIESSFIVGVK